MNLFSSSFQLTFRILKNQALPLLVLFAIGSGVSMVLEDQLALASTRDDTARIVFALTGGVADLIEGLILFFLVAWAIPRSVTWDCPAFLKKPFDRPYFSTFLAEYLRVLGHTLMWGLLLLIPGFVRYIQLIFVPFVVLFSARYEDGEVDALKLSTQIANRRWKIVFPVLLLSIVLSILLQLAPSQLAELHTVPMRILFYALGTAVSIWTTALMFLVFEQEMRK